MFTLMSFFFLVGYNESTIQEFIAAVRRTQQMKIRKILNYCVNKKKENWSHNRFDHHLTEGSIMLKNSFKLFLYFPESPDIIKDL